MNNTIGSAGTGYGTLGTLIANSTTVRQQLNTLTEQVSTGLVAQTYAGLPAGGANVSLNLNPQLKALQTNHDNINQATGRMQVTQTAMTQLQQIAATFSAAIPNLNGLSPTEIDIVAAQANAALKQVAQLLNTQDGTSFLFGGQDTGNPPVPSGDNILASGFYTQISAAVADGLSNGISGATIAATTLSIASSNATSTSFAASTSPFSAYLSQPPPGEPGSTINAAVVQTGEGGTVQTSVLASANSIAISSGSSTTGSYMRDLMRALATLGSLSSSQFNDPGFAAVVQDTGISLNGVVNTMAVDAGILGNAQANLAKTQTQLSHTATALSGQLSSVQDVDMATALSRLTSLQTQLQASYRLIAAENSLSLVNFLRAG
jgi:flagellar hook-associated protein 3 FlgL